MTLKTVKFAVFSNVLDQENRVILWAHNTIIFQHNFLKFCVRIDKHLILMLTRTDCNAVYYTRRQINQDRMIFGDFSINSEPIFLKFCKSHFVFKS